MKTNRLQTLLSCVIVIVSMALCLSVTSARAELKTITFAEQDAGDMIVKLENYEGQTEIVDSLTEKTQVQDEQIASCDKTVEDLNKVIGTQKESYEKQIKEVKPSFFRELGIAVSGAGIGAIIVAVLLIL